MTNEQLRDVRDWDRNDNSYIKAVSKSTIPFDEQVKLLTRYGSVTEYNGSLKKSTWELLKMIQSGKDVEMTRNLDVSMVPLRKEKLVYLESKVISGDVQDPELGLISISRSIKVVRMSAKGVAVSKSIVEQCTTHAQKEIQRYRDLGLVA